MSGRGFGYDGPPGRGPPPPDYRDRDRRYGGDGGGYRRDDRRGPPPPRGRYYDDRRGPPPRDDYYPPRRGSGGPRGDHYGDYSGPPPRGGRSRRSSGTAHHHQLVKFRSLQEEKAWIEERRRKRKDRKSKFDQEPTAEQLAADAVAAALSNPSATDFAGVSLGNIAAIPQQTRHARRIYVGNLPVPISESEVHTLFRQGIETALVDERLKEDPILSVYIDHQRHFAFLEFKTVEMATACLEFDGWDISGRGKVNIKRPNDYNPLQAPKVAPSALPKFDISRLGIIGGTVADGPNKIFIGGLHYNLLEPQILELLQAFGKVKAFHLVKNTPDAETSKGYCFVEFADPAVTPVAIQGLHGMDIGGGKSLTARLATGRSGAGTTMSDAVAAQVPAEAGAPPPDRNIVSGYDIEAMVDAALGKGQMPSAPQYMDALGIPLTRIVAIPALAPAGLPPAVAAATASVPPAAAPAKTRILVLRNMVTDEDLSTAEDHQALVEEVRDECQKFGTLRDIQVPRVPNGSGVEASAVRKIYLEYASVADAEKAVSELQGRQFGPNAVETSFYPEADFAAGRLR